MVSRVIPVDDFDLVIFGATGDLAHRKILPGLYRRFKSGQIPATSQIIGAARTEQDDEAFRADAAKAICAGCPVLMECREQALAIREPYGVWGGLSEDERRAIKRRAARSRLRNS